MDVVAKMKSGFEIVLPLPCSHLTSFFFKFLNFPEFEDDNPEAYEVPHGKKRKRRLIAREDSVSPPPETIKFGEVEDHWTKKSKIPRCSSIFFQGWRK